MKPLSQILRRFQTRVTIAIVLAIVLVLGLSDFLVYRFALDSQFNAIRQELMLQAKNAALFIDSDLLLQVPLNHDGVKSLHYQIIVEQLKKIKAINPRIKYIYTMEKTAEPGIWQFIVDPDPLPDREKVTEASSLPGDRYNAGRFPEMMKAFDGPAADTKLEVDEWGVTLSGYAPILDRNGRAAAMIGIDILADDVYNIQREVHRRGILVGILGVFLSLIVGMLISKHMTDPVEDLVEATQKIAQGDLKYRVKVCGNDEIGDLGRAFNQMAKSLYQSRKKIIGYLLRVVKTLIRILEVRDQYTRGHSEAVADYAGQIAERMGFSRDTVKFFKRITLLHDIGKLGIKDHILHKPGPLTEEEWAVMRRHPIIGEEILRPVLAGEDMLAIVRGHHERYDGTGYPDKLQRDKINVFASIVSVADAYHAMTSDRSYRKALSRAEAIAELKKHSGTQFNPQIVEIFLNILKEKS